METSELKVNSKVLTGDITDPASWIKKTGARAHMRAIGFKDEDFVKPLITVACPYINVIPCNFHFRELADYIVKAVEEQGDCIVLFVQLDDGRLWRRHVDDLLEGPLQNQTAAPHVPAASRAPPVVQEPLTPVVSSDPGRTIGPQDAASRESLNSSQEANRELQPVIDQAAMQTDASGPQPVPKVNLTPPPSLPVLRRLSRVITTPKRLITEI